PDRLPHREKELKKLIQFFKAVIEQPGTVSQKVIIAGNVGSGKTAMSKLFGHWMERVAQHRGINLKYVHVNCRRKKTSFLTLVNIVRAINPHIPQRGFSSGELLQILTELLDRRDLNVIVALDEIDSIPEEERQELIYGLTRFADDEFNSSQRLSLILIAKNLFFDELDPSVSSTLQHNILNLQEYDAPQLYDILEARSRDAFYIAAMSIKALRLISDIASELGDARYALELLWRAGKYADEERTLRVCPEHVRRAKADIYPTIRKEVLVDLSLHEKLLLLSIARHLRRTQAAYTMMGKIKQVYNIVCEEYETQPLAHTQLWEYIRILNKHGIIATKLSGKGMRGKTTLISLLDAPTTIIENELITLLEEKK
ncbi:MAG: ORC1-type DNA replication protein, partial [Promethearchaeota archaeon]